MILCKRPNTAEIEQFEVHSPQHDIHNSLKSSYVNYGQNTDTQQYVQKDDQIVQNTESQQVEAEPPSDNIEEVKKYQIVENGQEQWPDMLDYSDKDGSASEEEQKPDQQASLQLTNYNLERHTNVQNSQQTRIDNKKIYNQAIEDILQHQYTQQHEAIYLNQENKTLILTILEFLAYKLQISPKHLLEQIQHDQVTMQQLEKELAQFYLNDSKLMNYYNLLYFNQNVKKPLQFNHITLTVIISWLLTHNKYLLLESYIQKFVQATYQLKKIQTTNSRSDEDSFSDTEINKNVQRYSRNIQILQNTVLAELDQIHQLLKQCANEKHYYNTELDLLRQIIKNLKHGTEAEFSVAGEVQKILEAAQNQNNSLKPSQSIIQNKTKNNGVKSLMSSQYNKFQKTENQIFEESDLEMTSKSKRLTYVREILEKKLQNKKFRFQREVDYVFGKKLPKKCKTQKTHVNDEPQIKTIQIGLRDYKCFVQQNKTRRELLKQHRSEIIAGIDSKSSVRQIEVFGSK